MVRIMGKSNLYNRTKHFSARLQNCENCLIRFMTTGFVGAIVIKPETNSNGFRSFATGYLTSDAHPSQRTPNGAYIA